MKKLKLDLDQIEPEAIVFEEIIPIKYLVVGSREWFDGIMEPGVLDKCEYKEIVNSSDMNEIRDHFDTHTVQGLDTETGGNKENEGLDPISPTSKVLLAQYGTEDIVYLLEPRLISELKTQLQSSKHLIIGQNILHDFEFILMKYGFPMINLYDTMLAEQVLTAGMLGIKVGLKDLSRKYHPHYITSKSIRSQFINFRDGDKFNTDMLYYGARDVFSLFPIYRAQIAELKRLSLVGPAQVEFNCIPVTADMELTGITLCERILSIINNWYVSRQKELENLIIEEYNKELIKKGIRKQLTVIPIEEVLDRFDVNSSFQKLKALQELGEEYSELVDVQRETLAKLRTPLGNYLAEYTKCQKITSTYGQGLLDKISEWTGKFHPEFNQMGKGEDVGSSGANTTATGRYSSDAQQVPRPEKEYKELKGNDLAWAEAQFAKELKELGYWEVSSGTKNI